MEPVFPDFRNLSVTERMQLAEDRLASYRANPGAAIPWDEVRTGLYTRSR